MSIDVDTHEPKCATSERLILQGLIGAGGMAEIHKGFDCNLHRVVAVKRLQKKYQNDKSTKDSFIKEAQILAQIAHSNILPVYEIAQDAESGSHITMKLVSGRNLADLIRAGTKDRQHMFEILNCMLKVCDAVAFAHSKGVLHLDIKPDNILVEDFGEVYLIDWGISKTRAEATDTKFVSGTPHYMAPEQVCGKPLDEKTDIFLLGATLYEIAMGEPPYSSPDVMEIVHRASRSDRNAKGREAGCEFQNILRIALRAMEPAKEQRFLDVRELKKEIQESIVEDHLFTKRAIKAGELLVREGDYATELFVIESGECAVFRTVGPERIELRKLGRGDVFGETAILTTGTRTASVEAATDVVVKIISAGQFLGAMARESWMLKIIAALAERFKEADQRALELKMRLEEQEKRAGG